MGVQTSDNNNALTPDMVETLMQHERTRKICAKLYRHFEDIVDTDKLKLVIFCAGRSVRLTRTLHDDN
jgi:hypothetical protein